MVRQWETIGSPVAKGLVEELISECKRGKRQTLKNFDNFL